MNGGGVLDDLDRAIIDLMAVDARVSNRKLASRLGVTEGTVRGRIKRLQLEGLIAFTAITGLELARKSRLAFIGVQTDIERTETIAAEIAKMNEVNAVLTCLGEMNIVAICLFDELDELVQLASDQILSLPGVNHTDTSIAVKTLKYNARLARIT